MEFPRSLLFSMHFWFFVSLFVFGAFQFSRLRGFGKRAAREAEAALSLRLAKGEIGEAEYRRLKAIVKGDRSDEK
ncbi:hypothetical protein [Cohnella massiliensis]|uniref:hypothetical protein n=1 Tax=Cohnella massiliensis TaxID=1816691 RepID=UPI0009BAD4B1|nr:hypothetical protein [Cohnella massiliensis]